MGHDVGQRDALDAGRSEIGRDVGNRLMQRDREGDLAVLLEQSRQIGLHEDNTGIGKPGARGHHHRFEIAVEPRPERGGHAETLAAQWCG